MGIMAACMHYSFYCRCTWMACFLFHWERIHICSKGDAWAFYFSSKEGNNTISAHTGYDFETSLTQKGSY